MNSVLMKRRKKSCVTLTPHFRTQRQQPQPWKCQCQFSPVAEGARMHTHIPDLFDSEQENVN